MAPPLNDAQRRFVDAPPGPILAIAGAGTGKTTALVGRVERLVRHGVPPRSIAVFTFTLRAAGELVARLSAAGLPAARHVRAGTFHAEAARVLRAHPQAAEIHPEFRVLDRDGAEGLMERALAAALGPGDVGLSAKLALDTLAHCVRRQTWPAEVLDPSRAHLADALADVFAAYERQKRAARAADFDDLLARWRMVIDRVPAYRAGLEHVLVDEYQDVNLLQSRLIDELVAGHRQVAVVGDDAQAIYGFRGADLAPMRTFRARYPDADVVVLTQNHRCRPHILALGNLSIAHNSDRFPKDLVAMRPAGGLPVVAVCASAREEAEFVASRCRDILARNSGASIGVLHRANWHARGLVEALGAYDLPIASASTGTFFRAPHIVDILRVLRSLAAPRDAQALRAALGLLEGVGPTSIRRVLQGASDAPMVATLVRGLANRRLRGLPRANLEAFTSRASRWVGRSPLDPMEIVEDVAGWECLAHRFSAAGAARDLEALAGIASSTQTLPEFFDRIAILRAHGEGPLGAQGIAVTTVHRAKGLEWDVVFVTGMAESRFPVRHDNIEEERRLFHVAVTRARDELYLTYPRGAQTRDAGMQALEPSHFLQELGWLPGGADVGVCFDAWVICGAGGE